MQDAHSPVRLLPFVAESDKTQFSDTVTHLDRSLTEVGLAMIAADNPILSQMLLDALPADDHHNHDYRLGILEGAAFVYGHLTNQAILEGKTGRRIYSQNDDTGLLQWEAPSTLQSILVELLETIEDKPDMTAIFDTEYADAAAAMSIMANCLSIGFSYMAQTEHSGLALLRHAIEACEEELISQAKSSEE